MKSITLCAALLASSVFLAGCRSDEEAKAMLAKPDVIDVGTFEGCEVKFVDRGYQNSSFYLAKCGSTATLTRNWTQQNGKSSTFRRSTVITQEIEKLQAEKAAAEVKEKALDKLSADERTALGIK